MDFTATIAQIITSIVVLFLLTRIMGKKQISQMTFFDYVTGISIGSIAANFAMGANISYAKGISALVIFALFPTLLSYISQKSYKGRQLLEGKPTILIQDGQILERNLRKAKLNIDDLLKECRQKNAFSLADVETAILETSGKFSIQLKSQNQPLTPKDMNLQKQKSGLSINVIVDGEVLKDQLVYLGKDEFWLNQQLQNSNVKSMKEVMLAYMDSSNNLNVLKKQNCNQIPLQ